MTQNQIAYANLLENKRHNIETEGETFRHNVIGEGETERHNLATEEIGMFTFQESARHNKETEQISILNLNETRRSNQAKEAETRRANEAKEQENTRHNVIVEGETARHDRSTELLTKTANEIAAARNEQTRLDREERAREADQKLALEEKQAKLKQNLEAARFDWQKKEDTLDRVWNVLDSTILQPIKNVGSFAAKVASGAGYFS